MNKDHGEGDEPCDVAHNTYGLDMRDGQWRAHCGCGWESAASPDLGAQTGQLDEHLRRVVAVAARRAAHRQRVETAPMRLLDRNVLVGAVALAMAVLGGVAGWVDHDVDGV